MYRIGKTEKEFNEVAKKRDERLVGLFGEEIEMNGITYNVCGFTDRKCVYTVYIKSDFGYMSRTTVESVIQSVTSEDAKELVEQVSCFVHYNANPKGRNTTDCFIRAYAKAKDISWEEAFMKIGTYAMQNGYTMSSSAMIKDLMKAEKNERMYERGTVHEFATKADKGSYLVTIKGHIVAVVDNQYFDTWDCGSKKIEEVYKVN